MANMKRFLNIIVLPIIVIACGNNNGSPNPEITDVQPTSGPSGTEVTITGSGFSPEPANNTVTFGGTKAPVTSASESTIKTSVPEGLSSGPAEVQLTVRGTKADGPSFTIEQKAPGISSVEPDSGTVGKSITINGMNFSSTLSENTITFNGTQATVNSASEKKLTTEVPQGATDGPIKVTVKQKSTTGPDFDVITDGTLKAIISTSGDSQDNSYQLSINNKTATSSGNETVYISDLEKGSHQLELLDIAQNCSVVNTNPRSISISAGDTTSTSFDITCQAMANNKIVFESRRNGGYGDRDFFLMNADGSNPKLLRDSNYDRGPKISHDATQIVFSSNSSSYQDIFIMDVKGSNVRQVTSTPNLTQHPAWSPDDLKIAYADSGAGNVVQIYTIKTDGSEKKQLTNNSAADEYPSWSPDGDHIAFTSNRDGDWEIYIMNYDGTGVTQITNDADANIAPQWSPDGSKIAFHSNRDGDYEIYTINRDGTGLRQITNNTGDDIHPSWSPDGSEIVYRHEEEIYKKNADGSGTVVNLTAHSSLDARPHWSPVK